MRQGKRITALFLTLALLLTLLPATALGAEVTEEPMEVVQETEEMDEPKTEDTDEPETEDADEAAEEETAAEEVEETAEETEDTDEPTVASEEDIATASTVASGTCGDNLTWVLDGNGLLTISGTGNMADWSLASGAPWYNYTNSIVSVTVMNGVTSIGDGAFANCTSLTSITIPDGVLIVGESAFANCASLTSITIPDGVTTIAVKAFRSCTSLTTVTIPGSILGIWDGAFESCTSLTDVYYAGSEDDWEAINFTRFNTYLTSATIHYNSTGPESEDEDIPDYDVWVANTLVFSYEGTGGIGAVYQTFQDEEKPVYKMLGEYLLEEPRLVVLDETWSTCFNNEYRTELFNQQEYIYEILLMSYLTYGVDYGSGDSSESESGDGMGGRTAQTSSSGHSTEQELYKNTEKFEIKLFQTIAKEFSTNTYDYIQDMTIEEAESFYSQAEDIANISDAIKAVNTISKDVKTFTKAVAEYLALEQAKEDRITLLRHARDACAGSDYENKAFIKACDEIIEMMENLTYEYTLDKTCEYIFRKGMSEVWSTLCKKNTMMAAVDLEVTALNMLFNTEESASNNLKLALLYTLDCYMELGMLDAFDTYYDGYYNSFWSDVEQNSEDARDFIACFRGYLEFQMYGNSFAVTWLEDYVGGGVLSSAIRSIFNSEEVETAQDLIGRAEKEISIRDQLMVQIEGTESNYTKLYGDTEWLETLSTLTAPTITSLYNATNGVSVGWDAVMDATSYVVWRLNNSTGKWEKCTTTTDTKYLSTSPVSGTTYYYAIEAVNSEGSSGRGPQRYILYMATPKVSLENTTSGIKVSWNSVTGATSGYQVYRRTADTGYELLKSVSTSTTSYTDTTAKAGVRYYYMVRSVRGSTQSAYASQYITRLTTPAGISVSNVKDGVQVKWNAVTGATSYQVWRKLSGSSSWSKVGTTTDTSYTSKGVDSGKTYVFTVKAAYNSSVSAYNTTGKTIMRLAEPTITLENLVGGLTASWNAVDGAKGYKLYRRSETGSYVLVATLDANTLSYTDKAAGAGVVYYYRVQAYNGSYTSSWTSQFNRRIGHTTLTLTKGDSGVVLTWTESGGCTGYYIYRMNEDGSYTRIKTITSADTLTWMDTDVDLTSGNVYTYIVRGYNGSSLGSYTPKKTSDFF